MAIHPRGHVPRGIVTALSLCDMILIDLHDDLVNDCLFNMHTRRRIGLDLPCG